MGPQDRVTGDVTIDDARVARYELSVRSRLFQAVIAGGFALAAPQTLSACGADASREPSADAATGTSEPGEAGTDAAHSDAGHDADASVDGGWAPTK